MKAVAEKFLLICTFILLFPVLNFAAQIQIPVQVKPGELFVLKISPDKEKDRKILVKSEVGRVQFMGAVQGTPDIQMRSESLVEIEPKPGSEQSYELKYLALSREGETQFSIVDGGGQQDLKLSLSKEETSRNYSWFILAGGLALLILGIKLWRYQKSSPSMMSTKSLFMNYEELERARKMYFGEEGATGAQNEVPKDSETHDKTAAKPVDETTEKESTEIKAEEKSSQATVKSPSVKTDAMRIPSEQESEQDLTEDLVVTPDLAGSDATAQRPSLRTESVVVEAEKQDTREAGFCIEIADESGRKWEASGNSIKVGRRRDNQIILTGSEISREHVVFFIKNGAVFVKALTTSNITKLNGNDLKSEARVETGAKLNMGGTNFVVTKIGFV